MGKARVTQVHFFFERPLDTSVDKFIMSHSSDNIR